MNLDKIINIIKINSGKILFLTPVFVLLIKLLDTLAKLYDVSIKYGFEYVFILLVVLYLSYNGLRTLNNSIIEDKKTVGKDKLYIKK